MNTQTSSSRLQSQGKETIFSSRVYDVVRRIEKGSVLRYGEVATLAGFPLASRAVGSLMRRNFDPTIPCHRVICADGSVGQYNRGSKQKQKLLRAEGVKIVDGKVAV